MYTNSLGIWIGVGNERFILSMQMLYVLSWLTKLFYKLHTHTQMTTSRKKGVAVELWYARKMILTFALHFGGQTHATF